MGGQGLVYFVSNAYIQVVLKRGEFPAFVTNSFLRRPFNCLSAATLSSEFQPRVIWLGFFRSHHFSGCLLKVLGGLLAIAGDFIVAQHAYLLVSPIGELAIGIAYFVVARYSLCLLRRT